MNPRSSSSRVPLTQPAPPGLQSTQSSSSSSRRGVAHARSRRTRAGSARTSTAAPAGGRSGRASACARAPRRGRRRSRANAAASVTSSASWRRRCSRSAIRVASRRGRPGVQPAGDVADAGDEVALARVVGLAEAPGRRGSPRPAIASTSSSSASSAARPRSGIEAAAGEVEHVRDVGQVEPAVQERARRRSPARTRSRPARAPGRPAAGPASRVRRRSWSLRWPPSRWASAGSEAAGVPEDDRAGGRRQPVERRGERLGAVGVVEQQALGVQGDAAAASRSRRRRACRSRRRGRRQLQPAGSGRRVPSSAAQPRGQLRDVRGDLRPAAGSPTPRGPRAAAPAAASPASSPAQLPPEPDGEHDERRARRGPHWSSSSAAAAREPDRAQRGGAAAGHGVRPAARGAQLGGPLGHDAGRRARAVAGRPDAAGRPAARGERQVRRRPPGSPRDHQLAVQPGDPGGQRGGGAKLEPGAAAGDQHVGARRPARRRAGTPAGGPCCRPPRSRSGRRA